MKVIFNFHTPFHTRTPHCLTRPQAVRVKLPNASTQAVRDRVTRPGSHTSTSSHTSRQARDPSRGGCRETPYTAVKRPACLSGDPAPSRLNALRLKPATPSALWGRGSGSLPGSAQLFQVDPGSRPAAPGVSGGARSDDPNRLSRPTPERALPSRVGGAAEAASAPPRLRGGRRS